jgi:hypothetical protein
MLWLRTLTRRGRWQSAFATSIVDETELYAFATAWFQCLMPTGVASITPRLNKGHEAGDGVECCELRGAAGSRGD